MTSSPANDWGVSKLGFFVRSRGRYRVFCLLTGKKLTEKNQPSGMPKRSFREGYLEEIAEAIVFLEAINDPYYSALLGGLYDLFLVLKKTRYLNERASIPKNRSMRHIFWLMPPNSFRQIVRMNKETFSSICQSITGHPVFQNNSTFKQPPVWFQCMVVFERLGFAI